jgi:hypothetical protein
MEKLVPQGASGWRKGNLTSRLKERLLLVGAQLAVGCAVVGIVYAAIPNGNVITGCYKNDNGSLRVIDATQTTSCKPGETKLEWGQQGPQGIKGDKGDKGDMGDKGDPGPPGSAAAYTNYGNGSLQEIAQGDTQTVASVTLPTGSYTLMAEVYVTQGGDDTRFGTCSFAPGPPYVNGSSALADVADGRSQGLPLIGDVTVTSGTLPVFLRCSGLDGAIKATGALIATQVGTITPSE